MSVPQRLKLSLNYSTSLTLKCIGIPGHLVKTAGSDSAGLRWGLSFCIVNKHPGEVMLRDVNHTFSNICVEH